MKYWTIKLFITLIAFSLCIGCSNVSKEDMDKIWEAVEYDSSYRVRDLKVIGKGKPEFEGEDVYCVIMLPESRDYWRPYIVSTWMDSWSPLYSNKQDWEFSGCSDHKVDVTLEFWGAFLGN